MDRLGRRWISRTRRPAEFTSDPVKRSVVVVLLRLVGGAGVLVPVGELA